MQLDSAERLANELIRGCRLEGWSFAWDDAPRRFGVCRYREKQIGLSRKLVRLNDSETVLNVILHEIAHAIDFIRHGSSDHGPRWRQIALGLGCDGVARYSTSQVTVPPKRARISITDIGG